MKRKWSAVVIILLIVVIAYAPALAQNTEKSQSSRGAWLYVGGSGPGNYTRIQDAIDNASDGDTVFVYNNSSPYFENIKVNKRINLFGESRYSTIIDGRENGDVIQIYADNVSICELNIQNSSLYPQTPGGYGIVIDSCHNCTIQNNIVTHNCYGIRIPKNSYSNIVSNNYVIENQDVGIGIWVGNFWEYSEGNNKIINNTIYDSFTGINVDFSSGNEIRENRLKNMNEGIILSYSTQTIIFGNHVEKIINYGIRLAVSNNSIVLKNSVKDIIDNGVILLASSNCYISENQVINNTYGFVLYHYSESNTVHGNNIIDSNHGISNRLNSNKNLFYHNNLMNNLEPVYDECKNTWDKGYPTCGNYWDSYSGDDVFWGQNQERNGSDGVGDVPFNLPGGNNTDRYPLMFPYGWPYEPLFLGYIDMLFEKENIHQSGFYGSGGLWQRFVQVNTSIDELHLKFVMYVTIEMNYSLLFPFALSPLVAFGMQVNNYTDYSWNIMKLKHHGQWIWNENISQEITIYPKEYKKGDELLINFNISTIHIPF